MTREQKIIELCGHGRCKGMCCNCDDAIRVIILSDMADWLLSHQWVSVEDKLPEEGELVMTTFIDNKGKRRYAAGSKKTGAGMQVYGVISPSQFPPVTHWMPIPPLAEEGGGK